MLDSLRTTILASLGVITLAQEKLRSCIDDLVRKGELSKEQGEKVVSLLVEKGKEGKRDVSEKLSQEIQALMQKTPFVSRTELTDLERRVEVLEGQLASGAPSSGAAAASDETDPSSGS